MPCSVPKSRSRPKWSSISRRRPTCGSFPSRPCPAQSAASRKRYRATRTRRAGRYAPGNRGSPCGCARQLRLSTFQPSRPRVYPRPNHRAPPRGHRIDRLVRNFSVRAARIRFLPRLPPTYRWGVLAYQELDAFKACHQLTLAVHRLAEKLEEPDATLAGHLWAAALCASSRIARGSGFRNRRMFAACVDRTLSALSEISYYLDMGYAMGLIAKEERQELESLGGRRPVFSLKLGMSLAGGGPGGPGASPPWRLVPRGRPPRVG